ncbi:MAG: nitroreductase, partial [Clostridiaceae bacterium]|nr:nitroreductase [Clostridiaceae bacterium]
MCNKSIEEIIRLRTSIRTYRNQPLTEEVRKELDGYCKELKGPFGIKTRLKLVDCEDVMKESNIKLGTYGIIKGATTYIVAVAKKGGKDLEEIGYILEKLILYATSLGLGTCWLGGSFNRSSFSRAIDIKESESIIAVTPVGYPADSKRLIDSVMRRVAGSDSRKNWNELFFDGFFGNVLDKQKAGHYAVPLEMVRLAPSASNKQPWRVVVEEN